MLCSPYRMVNRRGSRPLLLVRSCLDSPDTGARGCSFVLPSLAELLILAMPPFLHFWVYTPMARAVVAGAIAVSRRHCGPLALLALSRPSQPAEPALLGPATPSCPAAYPHDSSRDTVYARPQPSSPDPWLQPSRVGHLRCPRPLHDHQKLLCGRLQTIVPRHQGRPRAPRADRLLPCCYNVRTRQQREERVAA